MVSFGVGVDPIQTIDWMADTLFASFVDAYADNNDMNMTSNKFERFSMRYGKGDDGSAIADGTVNNGAPSTTDVGAWFDVVKNLRGSVLQRTRRESIFVTPDPHFGTCFIVTQSNSQIVIPWCHSFCHILLPHVSCSSWLHSASFQSNCSSCSLA